MNNYGFVKVAAGVPTISVADCNHNAQQIITLMQEASAKGVKIIAFPELSLTGCTCGDLFLQPLLHKSAEQALMQIVEASADLSLVAVVGLPLKVGSFLYNCAAVLSQGMLIGIVPKSHISHSSERNELRYFSSGGNVAAEEIEVAGFTVPFGMDLSFAIDGVQFAVEIGEDATAPIPPSTLQSAYGAKLILNPMAKAIEVGGYEYLSSLIVAHSRRCTTAYITAMAGFGESSTDLAYGGGAMIVENGHTLAYASHHSLDKQLIIADVDTQLLEYRRLLNNIAGCNIELPDYRRFDIFSPIDAPEQEVNFDRDVDPMPFVPSVNAERAARCKEVFETQCLGLAKRLRHTSCKSAVIGISGGLDSTLALLVVAKSFDMLGLDRKGITGVTMPGFGTTDRTYQNAVTLIKELGVTFREIPIAKACHQHFEDIGLPEGDHSVTYENAQARERTQILMDVANMTGGMVIGTGDMSELALGWATYNGDQMSMYGVNASVPKTLVRQSVNWAAATEENAKVQKALIDVVDTPVSPELLPATESGDIAQKTEDLVGPYELHDFFIYNFLRQGFTPSKILFLAEHAFNGVYDHATIVKWLKIFFRRFFAQQFKRSAMPDGPKVGSVGLSPRGDWQMPSDASAKAWLTECEILN